MHSTHKLPSYTQISRHFNVPIPSWIGRLIVYTACVVISILWTIHAGKDLNWDSLNYHFYAGFSAINNRFTQDFFAASMPGYFNPYSYVPFYLMVSANWPAIMIGSALAALHSVNLILSYEIAVSVNLNTSTFNRAAIGILAIFLAFWNPIFLLELGSTFNDISTGTFLLAGWLLLSYSFQRPSHSLLTVAGILMGMGAALKLSNAIFAAAATIPTFFLLPKQLKWRFYATIFFSAGCTVGFAIAEGPWAWHMWKNFGNPLFPLLNNIFASPDFITEPIKNYRFIPNSLEDALTLPFRMVQPISRIHTEPPAPDIRYAVLLVLTPIWALIHKKNQKSPALAPEQISLGEQGDGALWGLTLGFAISWALWVLSSGNSRYFLPMGCMGGVLLASFLFRVFRSRRDWLALACTLLLTIQIAQISLGGQLRWAAADWSGPWFQVSIPQRLKQEPFLYLTTGIQTNSFLMPFLPSSASMMSLHGWYPLDPDIPGGKRAVSLIERNQDRLRLLTMVDMVRSNGSPIPAATEAYNSQLQNFDLKIDPSDCTYIKLQDGPVGVEVTSPGIPHATVRPMTSFFTCKLVKANTDLSAYHASRKVADIIFNRVEDACPNLFQPRRALSIHEGPLWRRGYMNTDFQLWINDGWVKYYDQVSRKDAVVIGQEKDWLLAPQPIDCLKKFMPLF